MLRKSLLIIILLGTICVFGCTKMSYISPSNTINKDATLKFTDEEIRKLFELQPQLKPPLKLAFYNAGYQYTPLVESLSTHIGANDVFHISPAFMEGERYYDQRREKWISYERKPGFLDTKQLRTYAAQAKADILLFCGIYLKEKVSPNKLAWSYVLLLPALFVHGQDIEVKAEMELFFIDVRNGFLYASSRFEDSFKEKGVTYPSTFSDDFKDKIRAKALEKIVPSMIEDIEKILSNQDFFAMKE